MKHMQIHKEDFTWVAKRFGIPVEEIVGYNSGICYSKVWVTTRSAAEKVTKAVKDDTVNGGMFHGMSLGGISEYDGKFEVVGLTAKGRAKRDTSGFVVH